MDLEFVIRRASLSGGGRTCFLVAGGGADGDGVVNRGVVDMVAFTILAPLMVLFVFIVSFEVFVKQIRLAI